MSSNINFYTYFRLNGFVVWPKTARESEAQKVRRVNDLVNFFFKDCSLIQRSAYIFNESNYSSNSASSTSSSSNSGRKINLVVRDGKGFRPAFCEFKAEHKRTSTDHQQSKTLRLSLTILEEMKKLFVDGQVVSFVWTDSYEVLLSLKERYGIFVARFAEPFLVPIEERQLDEDVCDAFVTMLNWKRHLLSTSEKAAFAKSKPARRETFAHTLHLPTSESAFTSFSMARIAYKRAVLRAPERSYAAQTLGSPVQRNAIYRFITGKMPTRLLLYRLALQTITSPLCIACNEEETTFQLFFRCPQKFIFWDSVIHEFLWSGTTVDLISSALQSLNFRPISVRISCPLLADIFLMIALSELWEAHWAHVHQRSPFLAETVFSQTLWSIQRRAAEDSNSFE
ncbi:hypothetical protein BD560DRAFT_432277 [Blakeslea trispora]|nr:hypothetical protein BD560DRAFT_432277 [Blakeslea trispora]